MVRSPRRSDELIESEIRPDVRTPWVRVAAGAALLVVLLRGSSPYLPSELAIAQLGLALGMLLWVVSDPRSTLRGADLSAIGFTFVIALVTAMHGLMSLGPYAATLGGLGVFLGVRKALSQVSESFRRVALLASSISVFAICASTYGPSVDVHGAELYLTGGKNSVALATLAAMVVLQRYWRPRSRPTEAGRLAVVGAGVLAMFNSGSSTALVVAVGVIGIQVLPVRVFRSWWVWLVGALVLHGAIVSGWLVENSPRFGVFLEGALGKDDTFTGRTAVWDAVIRELGRSPFGVGRGNSFIQDTVSAHLSEAHNLFLEASLVGGYPALVMLVLMIGLTMRESASSPDPRGVGYIWLAVMLGTMESIVFQADLYFLMAVAAGSHIARRKENDQRSYPSVQQSHRPGELLPVADRADNHGIRMGRGGRWFH